MTIGKCEKCGAPMLALFTSVECSKRCSESGDNGLEWYTWNLAEWKDLGPMIVLRNPEDLIQFAQHRNQLHSRQSVFLYRVAGPVEDLNPMDRIGVPADAKQMKVEIYEKQQEFWVGQ